MAVSDTADVIRGLQATIAALRRELAFARQTIAALQHVSGWAVAEPGPLDPWLHVRDGGPFVDGEI